MEKSDLASFSTDKNTLSIKTHFSTVVIWFCKKYYFNSTLLNAQLQWDSDRIWTIINEFIIFQSYYTKNNKLFHNVGKNIQFYQIINLYWRFGGLNSTCRVIEAQKSGWDRKMETVFIFIRNSGLRTMENKRLTLSRGDKGWKKRHVVLFQLFLSFLTWRNHLIEPWCTTTQLMLYQLSMSVKVIISSNCTYVSFFMILPYLQYKRSIPLYLKHWAAIM